MRSVAQPEPVKYSGGWFSQTPACSRAQRSVARIRAAAPSASTEQSRRLYGVTIAGELITSSTVIDIGMQAIGLAQALRWFFTDTSAICGSVVP